MMYRHLKTKIRIDSGEVVEAVAPVVISASRSTDIPAFHLDWFLYRLNKGYCAWKNPFNQSLSYISFQNVRCIVFWSKNPENLLDKLHILRERGISTYIQFTLNHYKDDGLEPNIPDLGKRIRTFKKLAEVLGKGSVIWRYDPVLLTKKATVDSHLGRIEAIGEHLQDYCEKLVFSFADISGYRKVQWNLTNAGIEYIDFTPELMIRFAKGLKEIPSIKNLELATCGEVVDLAPFGIKKNRCIDPELMASLFPHDKTLMTWLGYDTMFGAPSYYPKDPGQRLSCGCVLSKDIGAYNTCGHGCIYCYANGTPDYGKHMCKLAQKATGRECLSL